MKNNFFQSRSLLLSICLVFSLALHAQTFYVTPSGSGTQNGSSWGNAAPGNQLQHTINNAPAGSEIWVASGTYKPTQAPASCRNCSSSRDFTFFLKSSVSLYGGFSGTETLRTQRSISNNPTILSGDIGVVGSGDDNCFHVVLSLANDNTTVLDGFHITDGAANGFFYAVNVGDNNPFYVSGSDGAGIKMSQSGAQIRNCFFYNNFSFTQSSPGGGSAISMLFTSNSSIINCVFTNNTSIGIPNTSTILISGYSTPVITNSTFYGNNTPFQIISDYYSSLTMSNCVLSSNTGGVINLTNSGTANISHSLLPGGYDGPGNINASPLFSNPADLDGSDNLLGSADDGLKLQAGSFAIDGGNNSSLPSNVTTDITGAARVQKGTVDMGAYEGAICPQLSSGIIYVDSSKDVSGRGTSWSTAFRTLNEALHFVNDCDIASQIWVAKGTYYPSRDPQATTPGSRSAHFALKNNLAIYGGFNGNETSLSQRNILANPTILSGDIGVAGDFSDNIFTIVTASGNDNTAILDGFTIRDGDQRGASNMLGGAGLYTNGSPIIANCTFINNNTPQKRGGGILIDNGFPQILKCSFKDNWSNLGGAINVNGSGLSGPSFTKIQNCKFLGNSAGLDGSELNLSSAKALVINSVFLRREERVGEFLSVNQGRIEAINCTFLDASPLNLFSSTGNIIANCIFAGSYLGVISSEVTLNGTSISGFQSITDFGEAPIFVDASDPDGPDNILGTDDDGIRLWPR